jgi:hypothetical protein
MKTRCKEGTDRAKDLYDKCKQKDDLKIENEVLHSGDCECEECEKKWKLMEVAFNGWPRVWVSKEDAKERWPDTNPYQHKHDTNL